ncbi:hypothetical protein YPPY76_3345 [Yersinia pestis PY-76]|nr:hypothetical protein YPPY76_3345 [Yersinia pestis PY-76]
MSLKLIRLLTNPDDAILNGEDRQRSKAVRAKDGAARATWMYLRRLLRSACSLRRGHFVNNLNEFKTHEIHQR